MFRNWEKMTLQMMGSPHRITAEQRGVVPSELLLHKLDEVSKSVKVSPFSSARFLSSTLEVDMGH